MGERINTLRYLIRWLRDTEPKYSFEVLLFHLFMAAVCIIFTILGEFWLWAISITVLFLSLTVHYLRVRRAIRRRTKEMQALYEAFLRDERAADDANNP